MSKVTSRDTIKYIAICAMTLNHIGIILMKEGGLLSTVFIDIGYFTAVTMCFFLVEGYTYTRSKVKYFNRLLIVAIPSQLAYMLAFDMGFFPLNMMFSLLTCFVIIVVKETVGSKSLKVIYTCALIFAAQYMDWSFFAPIFTLLFLYGQSGNISTTKAFIISAITFGSYSFLMELQVKPLLISTMLTLGKVLPIIAAGIVVGKFYKSQEGKRSSNFAKYFFYIFYPAHLLILALVDKYL